MLEPHRHYAPPARRESDAADAEAMPSRQLPEDRSRREAPHRNRWLVTPLPNRQHAAISGERQAAHGFARTEISWRGIHMKARVRGHIFLFVGVYQNGNYVR